MSKKEEGAKFCWSDFIFVGRNQSRSRKWGRAQAARAHAFSLVRKGCKRTFLHGTAAAGCSPRLFLLPFVRRQKEVPARPERVPVSYSVIE